MKKILLSLLFTLLCASACAGLPKQPQALLPNEIARIDSLIEATEKSLKAQMLLREKMIEYKAIQDLHLKTPEDNDILYRLIISAHRTLKSIKENDLVLNFDPDFIDELKILSQAVSKRGIPKP